MNREGHEAVNFFVGTEVEHTPAFGQRTLFVVGTHDPQGVRTIGDSSYTRTKSSRCDILWEGSIKIRAPNPGMPPPAPLPSRCPLFFSTHPRQSKSAVQGACYFI